jgi:hypothetical protein
MQENNELAHVLSINMDVEPTFLSVSSEYLAAGTNNFVYIYRFLENNQFFSEATAIRTGDYFSMVNSICLSDTHLTVLTDHKCFLERINEEGQEGIQFPMDPNSPKIRFMSLSKEFLIMLDAENSVLIYSVKENALCSSFKPNSLLQKVSFFLRSDVAKPSRKQSSVSR